MEYGTHTYLFVLYPSSAGRLLIFWPAQWDEVVVKTVHNFGYVQFVDGFI
jgi:hypothetical protein